MTGATGVVLLLFTLVFACTEPEVEPEEQLEPGSWGKLVDGDGQVASASAEVPLPAGSQRGSELYQQHCSVCHGDLGAGDGPAAPYLLPAARDFTTGRFRLVSTVDRVPSEADLVASLRRGLPGSAMPAFGWLPERDLWSLAAHVRQLAVEGRARELAPSLGEDEALRTAARELTPGPPLRLGPSVRVDAEVRALGAALYSRHCAVCHGDDGKGRHEQPRRNEDGSLNWARDFTAGILKGGASHEALARRIALGIPGTAMGATELSERELGALVAHVRSLVPTGAEARLVHRARRIAAQRVDGPVPADPADERWNDVPEEDIVLAPLWWRDDALVGASLSALHDGERLAIRLRWEDDSADYRPFGLTAETDAAALQLTTLRVPQLFGMGSERHPANLWHWRALRFEDEAGLLDLLDVTPHMRSDSRRGEVRLDAPVYVPTLGEIAPSSRADSARASGVGEVERQSDERVAVRARAAAGGWEVVFSRSLERASDEEVQLLPGDQVRVACALWNGSAGDRGGRKSISIWHTLVLAP